MIIKINEFTSECDNSTSYEGCRYRQTEADRDGYDKLFNSKDEYKAYFKRRAGSLDRLKSKSTNSVRRGSGSSRKLKRKTLSCSDLVHKLKGNVTVYPDGDVDFTRAAHDIDLSRRKTASLKDVLPSYGLQSQEDDVGFSRSVSWSNTLCDYKHDYDLEELENEDEDYDHKCEKQQSQKCNEYDHNILRHDRYHKTVEQLQALIDNQKQLINRRKETELNPENADQNSQENDALYSKKQDHRKRRNKIATEEEIKQGKNVVAEDKYKEIMQRCKNAEKQPEENELSENNIENRVKEKKDNKHEEIRYVGSVPVELVEELVECRKTLPCHEVNENIFVVMVKENGLHEVRSNKEVLCSDKVSASEVSKQECSSVLFVEPVDEIIECQEALPIFKVNGNIFDVIIKGSKREKLKKTTYKENILRPNEMFYSEPPKQYNSPVAEENEVSENKNEKQEYERNISVEPIEEFIECQKTLHNFAVDENIFEMMDDSDSEPSTDRLIPFAPLSTCVLGTYEEFPRVVWSLKEEYIVHCEIDYHEKHLHDGEIECDQAILSMSFDSVNEMDLNDKYIDTWTHLDRQKREKNNVNDHVKVPTSKGRNNSFIDSKHNNVFYHEQNEDDISPKKQRISSKNRTEPRFVSKQENCDNSNAKNKNSSKITCLENEIKPEFVFTQQYMPGHENSDNNNVKNDSLPKSKDICTEHEIKSDYIFKQQSIPGEDYIYNEKKKIPTKMHPKPIFISEQHKNDEYGPNKNVTSPKKQCVFRDKHKTESKYEKYKDGYKNGRNDSQSSDQPFFDAETKSQNNSDKYKNREIDSSLKNQQRTNKRTDPDPIKNEHYKRLQLNFLNNIEELKLTLNDFSKTLSSSLNGLKTKKKILENELNHVYEQEFEEKSVQTEACFYTGFDFV